jgi:Trk K+ transport system NAD-binding subunit
VASVTVFEAGLKSLSEIRLPAGSRVIKVYRAFPYDPVSVPPATALRIGASLGAFGHNNRTVPVESIISGWLGVLTRITYRPKTTNLGGIS